MSEQRQSIVYLPLTCTIPFPIKSIKAETESVTVTVTKDSQIKAVLSAIAIKKIENTSVFVSVNADKDIPERNTLFSLRTNRLSNYGFICNLSVISIGFENSVQKIDQNIPLELLHSGVKNITFSLTPVSEAKIDSDLLKLKEINFKDSLALNCLTVEENQITKITVNNDIAPDDQKSFYLQLYASVREYIASGNNIPFDQPSKLEFNRENSEVDIEEYPMFIFKSLKLPLRYLERFLSLTDLSQRYIDLAGFLEFFVNRQNFDSLLNNKVRENIEKNQKNYYISEQIKTLREELNDGKSDLNDKDSLLARLAKANPPKEIYEKLEAEINRLDMIPASSSEGYLQRNYIEWALNIPWHGDQLENIDLQKSRKVLDEDHFGLDDVKERILEYLAVLARVKNAKCPILCLIGPPGVGKTSLGKSIARATGRKYTRLALGGVNDEAEIRGHRRTYVGSQPGRILQSLSKVKVNNPLFLLDEIDKLTANNRGDPASALLEVLDPEQNNSFSDHFIELDYDLSKVLFIATANSYDIPYALLDRMEIIDLGSYTRDEKFEITQRHILPKLLKRNGIKESEIDFSAQMINFIIDGYTNEAGVRSLERRIERILRYSIKEVIENQKEKIVVNEALIEKVLGPIVNEMYEKVRDGAEVGLICGLAYTSAGGDVLPIEVATTTGKGTILHTGSLGDNIKESVQAAITVIRQRTKQFGLKEDFYKHTDFHIHFPNAAVKKDGPSAGAAITTCLISSLTKKPIDKDIGMTGEISLMGRVLKIGGIKEKVISAHRNGVKHIILPKSNYPDLYKIPQSIKDELQFYPVETIDEVVDIVFGDKKLPTKINTTTEAKFIEERDRIELDELANSASSNAKVTTKKQSSKANVAKTTKITTKSTTKNTKTSSSKTTTKNNTKSDSKTKDNAVVEPKSVNNTAKKSTTKKTTVTKKASTKASTKTVDQSTESESTPKTNKTSKTKTTKTSTSKNTE